MQPQLPDFEQELHATGLRLSQRAGSAPPGLLTLDGSLRGRLLSAALQNDGLRTALFRFVDTLPAMTGSADLAAHFRAYLQPFLPGLGFPWSRLAALGGSPVWAFAVRGVIDRLAGEFLAEETPSGIPQAVEKLRHWPAGISLDAVGEAALSEPECDAYRDRYLQLLSILAGIPDLSGQPAIALSLKLSALTAHFDPLDYAGVRRRVFQRLAPIVERLSELGGTLTVDMEQFELKPLILRLFRDMAEEWADSRWLPGIALQAYLEDTPRDLHHLLAWCDRRGHRIGIRLVKGAYWDTEIALAAQRHWPVPVLQDKAATDLQFENLIDSLFAHSNLVYPAIGTHNLRSLAYAMTAARRRGLSERDFEFQMLHGMAESLGRAVAAEGAALRIYLPTGDLRTGMAYLIRRLVENTANTSVLRQTYVEKAELSTLLARPAPQPPNKPAAPRIGFQNAPLRDFSQSWTADNFAAALTLTRSKTGSDYLLDIDGAPDTSAGFEKSRNPAAPREILINTAVANAEVARRAVRNARQAFPGWRDTPVAQRVALCRRAAALMELRRDRLAAIQVLEVGKNWREADADVAEAIDFLRYYAERMESLAGWQPTVCFPGEPNHWRYEPRGVAVVIAPWNFPLAILTGMTAAALVAGNTVIMKPAPQANWVAQSLKEILDHAGFPRGVCQLLPGSGSEVGETLVSDPEVNLIAFTGSRTVGLEILRQAHSPAPRQGHIKQVVCELGGKNAVIVDTDADLDDAVLQVLHSAFGFQGQKCSACSRLIAVGPVHDRLVQRLAEALDAYEYGPPEDPAYLFGPMVSAAAQKKALEYLAIGRQEGHPAYIGRVPKDGFYCPPAIFTGIEPRHRLAREEIFGPILAVLRADSFAAAIDMAMDSEYALTAGVFSRFPDHIALARERLRVGNLYINRRTTGARVGIQPFGGVGLSGTGIQAGGPDYLKQFLWTRSVSESTMRHGFAPD